MLKTHTEEAACVTHGGVIMNMLSQHALPFRKPEEWMTDPGAGYSVRLDAEMWMRDHLAEAYDVVPHGYLDAFEQQEESRAKQRELSSFSYKKRTKKFQLKCVVRSATVPRIFV